MGIMIYIVEVILDMKLEMLQYSTAVNFGYTSFFFQCLEFQVSRYRQLEADYNLSFAVPKSDSICSKPYYNDSGPCLFHLDLVQ